MVATTTGPCLCATLLLTWCVQIQSEPSCDQTESLHPNGSCVPCPVCPPGEQLTEDCGFGDGGEGVCVVCEAGRFSAETSVAPCIRCTQCHLLNRLERAPCLAVRDAACGRCRPGYYELRSLTGEVELSCVPCQNKGKVREECVKHTDHSFKAETTVSVQMGQVQELQEKRIDEGTFSMVLIGSATASSIFLLALLIWAFFLTAEKFKQVADYCHGGEGLGPAAELQHSLLPNLTEGAVKPLQTSTQSPTEDPQRCLSTLNHENEVHPTSIVINVTTNIKPSGDKSHPKQQEEQGSSSYATHEMEQKLQKIWEVAQGQGIEILDYDSVQDLSLLLDAVDNRGLLRRLGRSLGVPPQVVANLHCFQDLFQYLRTSTYILLPQLAQAAALLPNPEIVARIHQAVVNK